MDKRNFYIKCIILVIIQIIVGVYSYDLYQRISDKHITTYQIDDVYTTQQLESDMKSNYKLFIEMKNPDNLLVNATIHESNGERNLFEYRILSNDGKCLNQGSTTIDDILLNNGVLIDGNLVREIGEGELIFEITSCADVALDIPVSADGYLSVIEYFDFTPYLKLRWLILIGNIMLLGINILLCNKVKLEYKFLVTSFVLGVIATVVVAPCSAPDEWRHFLRAYDIAQGNLVCDDITEIWEGAQSTGQCVIPIEYLDIKNMGEYNNKDWTHETVKVVSIPHYLSLFKKNTLSGEMIGLPMLGTYDKSILEYLPQVIFIILAKLLKLAPIGVFYASRIGNVLVATLLTFLAIRITPMFKYTFSCLSFLPVITFLRSTSSNDGFLLSLVLLFFAYILRINSKKKNIYTVKNFLTLVLLCSYMTIIKFPYALLGMAVLLIDTTENRSENIILKEKLKLFIYSVMIVGLSLAFYTIINSICSCELAYSNTPSMLEVASYTIKNIPRVWSLLVRTYLETFNGHLQNAIAWPVGSFCFISYIILLFWVCSKDDYIEWKKLQKCVIYGGSFFVWAVIIFAFYTVSVIGCTEIWGIQGRYMIPIFVLLALGMPKGKQSNKKMLNNYEFLLILNCNIVYFIKIFQNYWF